MQPRVLRATSGLVASFSPGTGRWRTPTGEAWQPAVAVEAMLLAYERTGDVVFLNVVEKSFARYAGRRSRFFDDDGWYLNAWLRAYDLTGDPKYLAEGRALFDVMTTAWDERCGGGVWWSDERSYKNAITNELFLLAAARLARRVPAVAAGRLASSPDGAAADGRSYVDWADRSWRWFAASGLINADGLVNDGLDGDCRNNGQPTWTYNQGVILSALVELWRRDGDATHLEVARRIALAATARLVHVHNGQPVLREVCEPDMGNRDAHAFKGIFAQGLGRLCTALAGTDPETVHALRTFLLANADAACAAADERGSGFGMAWTGPPGPVNAATEASAALLLGVVDLLEADPGTDQGEVGSVVLGDVVLGEVAGPSAGPARVYEAEQAELDRVSTEALHGAYSGSGYVAGWNHDGAVTFRCTVDGPGPHIATLRYAAGAGDAFRCVLVDGEVRADRLLFTSTGGWDAYSTVSLGLALAPGERSVTVRFDEALGSRNYLNLDQLVVR